LPRFDWPYLPPVHQPDAYLSQDNPVSAEWYTVLDTTVNVRIIGISARISWATTQPTPLEVQIRIDGVTLIHGAVNPVSGTNYYVLINSALAEIYQTLSTVNPGAYCPFAYEGRSVKVEVRITWATTQPTPLVCRVKYAKW